MNWAIIPARNEEKRIGKVIKEVKKYITKIIVVDDGSTDKTRETAKKEGAEVLTHIVNLGKGAALKTGCDYAITQGADKIVVLDADGQHDPNEIPNFLQALQGKDIIFGYRKLNKEMPMIFRVGNMTINKIVQILFGMQLKDTQGGYRAFTAETYKKIRWKSGDYFVESEMIANVGKKQLKYKQIPIKTIYTDRYKGTTMLDGIKIVLNMFLWRIKG